MQAGRGGANATRKRNAIVFACVVVVWFAVDSLTKSHFNGLYEQGEAATGPILGLVRFRLVHNTGMAWGMFDDSTFLLGALSLVVCAALVAYLFVLSPRASLLETLGISFVVAGGLGNAVDRFLLGYVVDFIEPTFIDFPVFNVADIGVTCGFVLFLVGMLLAGRRESREEALAAGASPARPQSPSGEAGSGEGDEGSDGR